MPRSGVLDRVEKSESLKLRLAPDEKEAFTIAAEISGLGVSAWVRERLRVAAFSELSAADMRVPFLHRSRDKRVNRRGA